MGKSSSTAKIEELLHSEGIQEYRYTGIPFTLHKQGRLTRLVTTCVGTAF